MAEQFNLQDLGTMRVQLQGLVDHVLLGRLAEPEELGRRKRSAYAVLDALNQRVIQAANISKPSRFRLINEANDEVDSIQPLPHGPAAPIGAAQLQDGVLIGPNDGLRARAVALLRDAERHRDAAVRCEAEAERLLGEAAIWDQEEQDAAAVVEPDVDQAPEGDNGGAPAPVERE